MIINLDKVNIPKKIVKELDCIFSSFDNIQKVVLFGSRARKDNKVNSDIDIAIYGNVEEDKYKINNMIDEINTIYSFDVIFVCEEISENLLNQIKKDGSIIYER